MCPPFLCAVWRFKFVYLHAQTEVDAGDIHTWQTTVILIINPKTPIWAQCQDKYGAGSGISPVYLWV